MVKPDFPHILTLPTGFNGLRMRVVTDQSLEVGDRLAERCGTKYHPSHHEMEPLYRLYEVTQILESRRARGEWENWPAWPTYYEMTATVVNGAYFKSDVPNAKITYIPDVRGQGALGL